MYRLCDYVIAIRHFTATSPLGTTDILTLRMLNEAALNYICRLLQQMTMSKMVWLHQAMILESQPDIVRADEHLSGYAAEELEECMLQHPWIKRSLDSRSGLNSRHCVSKVRLGIAPKLITGGHWLH